VLLGDAAAIRGAVARVLDEAAARRAAAGDRSRVQLGHGILPTHAGHAGWSWTPCAR